MWRGSLGKGWHFSQELGREFKTTGLNGRDLRSFFKKLVFLNKHEGLNIMISMNSGLGFSIYNLFDLGQSK